MAFNQKEFIEELQNEIDLSKYLAKSNPQETLEEHTDNVIKCAEQLYNFGYIKDEKIYKALILACYYHDFGKMNKRFQERIQNQSKFDFQKELYHNLLSLFFIDENKFDDEKIYKSVCYAVINHHNYCDTLQVYQDYSKSDNNNEDKNYNKIKFDEFFDEFKSLIKMNFELWKIQNIYNFRNKFETILIKGLLHRCDYSASAGIDVELKNNFLLAGLKNMLSGWKQNENAEWNELQHFCIDNRDKNMIVVAQTGKGKTEGGLLWVGDNKGIFVLPIKAAINAIYDRIREKVLQNEEIDKRVAVLHSDTQSVYYRLAQDNNIYKNDEISFAEYYEMTKQLCMPITVTTLDQIFDFVFKYPGHEAKLSTLSYSKVIIDEIQMYGADLLAYLIYGINKITEFGGKVAVLTATLYPFVRDLLIEKGFYKKDEVAQGLFIDDDNVKSRHSLKCFDEKINADFIYQKYMENKENGKSNKILVICNTVKKCQELFVDLKDRIDENKLNLLHKKFIKGTIEKKEKEIIEFGKTFKDGIKNLNDGDGIWICTSMVEASLDIDFDMLITELSDFNGLLQRLGRCNRKGEKVITDYNCYVFLEIDKIIINQNYKTQKTFGYIDKDIFSLSKEAIKQIDGEFSEKRKIELIEEYFTTEKLKKCGFIRKFYEIYNNLSELNINDIKTKPQNLRNIVAYDIIPSPVYDENKAEIDDCIQKFNEIEKQIQEMKKSKINEKELENLIFKKVEYRNKIKDFTVSVQYFVYQNSEKKVINLFEGIDVLECDYDEMGFKFRKAEKTGKIIGIYW